MPPAAIETCEQPQIQTEKQPIPLGERVLTEVDHLTEHRLPDGSYPDKVLSDLKTNLVTAVKESSIPFAVSRTEREFVETPAGGKFMWLGKTAVESAQTGYSFHFSEAAQKRVDIEVDEARYLEEELEPGVMKVFISPRMSQADAPREIAEQEHLAEDDQIRINWLNTDETGGVTGLATESILVRDIPLSAWVAMLEDPNNIFGKAISVDDPQSALSLFKVHRELELDPKQLPEGCISLLEAVLPYVEDKAAKDSLVEQIGLFRGDQEHFDHIAEKKAMDWLAFENELSESLAEGEASFELRRFIAGLQHNWGEEALDIISNHMQGNARYVMTRQLAIVLENAKRNTLWSHTGIEVGDKKILNQMDAESKDEFQKLQNQLMQAEVGSQSYLAAQAAMNRFIASSGVKTGGGGCPGNFVNMFGEANTEMNPDNVFGENVSSQIPDNERSKWKWRKGHCQVKSCPTRPNQTMVGPCDVCMGCQAKFDNGIDPTK